MTIEFKNYKKGLFEVHHDGMGCVGCLVFDYPDGKWFYLDDGNVILDSRDMRALADKLDEMGYEP